ncbi:HD domain-containing protein [Patescibacteria group bacterium]|nr:HD domain-containing protein [Patescibacteria group bacterium]MBU1629868.1 HD domain-containing protein [Patescibacteria group bacterium]MBU1907763.1 HD domain-containing protein [Patescibacteria group bacterium]
MVQSLVLRRCTLSRYDALFEFLRDAPQRLRRVQRWRHYRNLPEKAYETVEQHSLVSVWLMGAMLALEKAEGTHALNEARLLLAASLHDVGEGEIGIDLPYAMKRDSLLKAPLAEYEHRHVLQLLDAFPKIVGEEFKRAYALESEAGQTLDGDFFNAVERVGYMLFAVEYVERGCEDLIVVFERQHAALVAYSERFSSVRQLYAPYRSYVEQRLAKAAEKQAPAPTADANAKTDTPPSDDDGKAGAR